MRVLIIPEDPTLDQFVLTPIVQRIFTDLDIGARVEVLFDPHLSGADQALDGAVAPEEPSRSRRGRGLRADLREQRPVPRGRLRCATLQRGRPPQHRERAVRPRMGLGPLRVGKDLGLSLSIERER